MKKIKKKSIKKRPVKKRPVKKRPVKKAISVNKITKKRVSLISRIIKTQHSLKPEFNIKINFNLEKYIQLFFDKIANTIQEYKTLRAEDKRKRKLDEIEKKEKERI